MPHAQRTIVIARPQAEVYAFFADAENDKRWRPGSRTSTARARSRWALATPSGSPAPAAARCPPTSRSPRSTPTRAWPSAASPGPVRPEGDYSFAPAEGGTAVTFTLDAELTGVKKLLMAKPVQKSMDAEMANLDKAKALLESGG